ncbi:MAG: 50S ribosomal protein L11 methyltransferase [Burkholderiales bacterium]|nr:50S ribosomal protein L11 methyltransferase [Burkholderiales bacterium]
MGFNQLVINLDSKDADELSDIFVNLGALSVSIEDRFEGTKLEEPIFDEPGITASGLWSNSKLLALFDPNMDIQNIITEAKIILGHSFEYLIEHIDNQDWIKLTQSQFQPIKISDKYYIVPSWHEIPDPNATAIMLDPGLAFGTGSHPTTFMCLEWLVSNITSDRSVLDYGCGSGILAIAAKKFGASIVYGVDIDNQAIIASTANALNNNVDINFSEPEALPQRTFDIVVANILSNPLRILAPILAKLCGHKLILSGILDSQQDELMAIYSQWFNSIPVKTMEGWVLLECTRHEK